MRNVVLLCLDSVRKDTFDEQAPRLRERADLEFTACRAASSWSAPSYASMLTGELPHEHGVHTHDKHLASVQESETFLTALDSHTKVGVSTNIFSGSAYGFDRFFDQFADVTETGRFADGLDPGAFRSAHDGSGARLYVDFLRELAGHDHPLRSFANGVIGVLDTVSEAAPIPKLFDDGATAVTREGRRAVNDAHEPVFLFGTFMEAHTPLRHIRGFDRSLHSASNRFSTAERTVWELMDATDTDDHEVFLETRRGLYDATVEYLDRTIAPFVDWLEANTERETTIVITADHGENQGYPCEEGCVRHKSSLSEGLLHVPLVVINPPEGYPAIEDEFVSHLELGRLLSAFARDEVVDVTAERIVAEHVGMSAGPEPPANEAYWDRLLRAAYEDQSKFVWDSLGNRIEYAIDPDRPCWQRRVADDVTLPDWATERFDTDPATTKRRLEATARSSDTVDESVQDRLTKLGYA